MAQIKWFIIALIVAFVLVSSFENIAFTSGTFFEAQNTFLGLNLFLEILIFLVFSIFVVFGIKGYFEFYSKKISNIIISVSGSVLFLGILILLSQILLQEWVINKIISFTKKEAVRKGQPFLLLYIFGFSRFLNSFQNCNHKDVFHL